MPLLRVDTSICPAVLTDVPERQGQEAPAPLRNLPQRCFGSRLSPWTHASAPKAKATGHASHAATLTLPTHTGASAAQRGDPGVAPCDLALHTAPPHPAWTMPDATGPSSSRERGSVAREPVGRRADGYGLQHARGFGLRSTSPSLTSGTARPRAACEPQQMDTWGLSGCQGGGLHP